MTQSDRNIIAALAALILLQVIMLSALYAGVAPHPPRITPISAIAPFLGAAIAVAFAAIVVGPRTTRTGRALSVVATLMALLSFGPQKYFDDQIALIWPAVVLGQSAVVVIIASVLGNLRKAPVAA
ncbi:MAG: hypothetical protein AAFP69_05650 [Planctomycetota bacterium]